MVEETVLLLATGWGNRLDPLILLESVLSPYDPRISATPAIYPTDLDSDPRILPGLRKKPSQSAKLTSRAQTRSPRGICSSGSFPLVLMTSFLKKEIMQISIII